MKCPKCGSKDVIDNGQGQECNFPACGYEGSLQEFQNPDYIAILECSAGNQEVGHMWQETKICNKDTTIWDLMCWKGGLSGNHGRLIITKASE